LFKTCASSGVKQSFKFFKELSRSSACSFADANPSVHRLAQVMSALPAMDAGVVACYHGESSSSSSSCGGQESSEFQSNVHAPEEVSPLPGGADLNSRSLQSTVEGVATSLHADAANKVIVPSVKSTNSPAGNFMLRGHMHAGKREREETTDENFSISQSASSAEALSKPKRVRKRRRRGPWVGQGYSGDLPEELLQDLAESGAAGVSFVDVDARASARAAVADADRAAALGGAIHRAHSAGQTISRAQKRTHHITSLAANAVASIAARKAAEHGSKPRPS
jgi:hypothetical protein